MTEIDAVLIAQALIRCPSVTPNEAGALAYLASLLEPAGFTVHRPVFSQPGTPDVENLYARIGEGEPALVFAGHTDVVPPGDAALWSLPPFSGEIAGGMLWGRGAADMKAGVAASIAAALQYVTAHGAPKRGSIAFLITGDEEGPAVNGTVKLLDWAKARGERFDHCILGEPTNPGLLGEAMKNGRRGSLTGTIIVHGRQGHVAYPHRASNPIPVLARMVLALTGEALDQGTAFFGPSTIALTTFDVDNPATNIIPASARATFNVRFNDLWTPESLAAELIRRAGLIDAEGTRHEMDFLPTNAVAFLTQPGPFIDLVSGAIEAETGVKPELSTTGGTSDARFIKDHCEVIEFGLVGKTMHQMDEHVAIADIEALTRIYLRIIEAYHRSDAEVG